MKVFKRARIPDQVTYNGQIYKVDIELSSAFNIDKAKKMPDVLLVEVYNKNLRGKTDLHGNPYKPSEWIFTPQK